MPLITIIIPVYNEAEIIKQTAEIVSETFAGNSFELLIVDDGSTDGTWDAIETIARENSQIHGIKFSRNFGKEAAMFAGLDNAAGDCAIIMDGDLQHPPKTALEMFRVWQNGNVDIVEGIKKHRQKESSFNRFAANMFYSVLKSLSGVSLKNASDFKLLDRKTIDQLRSMPERQTFFRAMTGWTGLRTVFVEYETAPRAGGETKFSLINLFKLAIDSIISYSSAPLVAVTFFGFIFCGFGAVLGIHTLFRFFTGHSLEGFSTVILLLLIIGGIMMVSLGIIGVYIAKIYNEIKQRPRYIIGQSTREGS